MTSDYADWLNPMLVKELRQGLRKSLFVAVFLLVQVAMIILIGFRLLSTNSGTDGMIGGFLDGVLWTGLGLALLVAMPFRGLTAIAEEQKANTLDLVQMTRMGSTGIVLGKWVAIVSQSLLIAVAVLPYAVLRYFFGGVNVVDNLQTLLQMLLGSGTATALCLWLSTMPAVGRGVGIGLTVYVVPNILFASRIMGASFVSGTSMLVQIYSAVIITAYLLALAASRIAPLAENHASRLRLLTLLSAMVALVSTLLFTEGCTTPAIVLFVWTAFEAFTEQTSEVPSLYAPWAKRGALGRLAGRFLYPGWATGLLFTFVLAVLATACVPVRSASGVQQHVIFCALAWLALVWPLAVLVLVPRVKQRGLLYFALQLGAGLLYVVSLTAFDGGTTDKLKAVWLSAILPTSAFFSANGLSSTDGDAWRAFVLITLPIGALIVAFLMIKSRREFRLIREQEQRALADSAPTTDA